MPPKVVDAAKVLFIVADTREMWLTLDLRAEDGKHVILGLISTKTPVLESKDVLKRRIDEASKHLPLDQLCLSPQCGFASNFMGNPVTVDDEKRKLSLVVEIAKEVWG